MVTPTLNRGRFIGSAFVRLSELLIVRRGQYDGTAMESFTREAAERPDELRKVLQEFEEVVSAARRETCAADPDEVKDELSGFSPLAKWNLLAFFDQYLRAGTYPAERLDRLVYYLMDVKLQLYCLIEVDLGLYNSLVYGCGYNDKDPRATPHVHLTRLSLDQSLILKSRVLWERIMNWLYYLETGAELEKKVSGSKSKRKVFFEDMLASEEWRFLEPYRSMLDRYDLAYRAAESHKSSVLRGKFMRGENVDLNELLSTVNSAINALWDNVMSIVGGGHATNFTELHMNEKGELDSKYGGP